MDSAGLRERVRAILPDKVLNFWDLIESTVSQTIEVRMPAPSDRPRQASSLTNENSAAIYVPTHSDLDGASAYHELQHIHRIWIEGVPQIVAKLSAPTMRSVAALLDNDIEHSIIVPRQIEAGLNDPFHLQDQIADLWAGYPWPITPDTWRRRYTNFNGALCAQHLSVTHQQTISRCLAMEGFTREAALFVNRMNELIDDKPRLTACMIRFVKLRREDFLLRYTDIRNRRSWVEEIPPY